MTEQLVPRPYQQKLHDLALKENIIICMDPGTGKTLVAAMLINSILDKEKKRLQEVNELSDEGELTEQQFSKSAVFLVDTVALVDQQSRVLTANCHPYVVNKYTGNKGVDFFDKAEWERQYRESDVLVMTAQIFYNTLRPAFIDMSSIAVLIFDECHHTRKKHPFNRIMQEFYFKSDSTCNYFAADKSNAVESSTLPRILGLTASSIATGWKKCQSEDQVKQQLLLVAANMDSKLIDAAAEFPEINEYINTPVEELVYFQNDAATHVDVDSLLLGLPLPMETDNWRFSMSSLLNVLEELGFWCGYWLVERLLDTIKNPRVNQFKRSRETVSDQPKKSPMRVLPEQIPSTITPPPLAHSTSLPSSPAPLVTAAEAVTPDLNADLNWLKNFRERLVQHLTHGSTEIGVTPYPEQCFLAPQAQLFLAVLLQEYHAWEQQKHCSERETASVESFCCIVFTQRRYTSYALTALINAVLANQSDGDNSDENETKIPSIRAAALTSDSASYTRISKNDSQFESSAEVLNAFHNGSVNVLVATSVAQEGVDVRLCHLVIRFNPNHTVASYVQSRGRARLQQHSKYILMVNATIGSSEDSELAMLRQAEKFMKVGESAMAAGAYNSGLAEVKSILSYLRSVNEKYVVESTGAVVSRSSAVSLIYMYCSVLPCDKYQQKLGPHFEMQQDECGIDEFSNVRWCFRCALTLPPQAAVVGTLISEYPSRSKRTAREMVALAMCCRLHEAGGLDDNLLPAAAILTLRGIKKGSKDNGQSLELHDSTLYAEVMLGKEESTCRERMRRKYQSAYECPPLTVSSAHAISSGKSYAAKEDHLPASSIRWHCYDVDSTIYSSNGTFNDNPVLFGLLSAVDLRLPGNNDEYNYDSEEINTLLHGPLRYSYLHNDQQLQLRYHGSIVLSSSELQELHQYLGVLMALVVSSTLMDTLLKPLLTMPEEQAPLMFVPLTRQEEPSPWQERIDWNEIRRVISAAKEMKELAKLEQKLSFPDVYNNCDSIMKALRGEVVIGFSNHQTVIIHALHGISPEDIPVHFTHSNVNESDAVARELSRPWKDLSNEADNADGSANTAAVQITEQPYDISSTIIFATRAPQARDVIAASLTHRPKKDSKTITSHESISLALEQPERTYICDSRDQLRCTNYFYLMREYFIYPLQMHVAVAAAAFPLLLSRAVRRIALFELYSILHSHNRNEMNDEKVSDSFNEEIKLTGAFERELYMLESAFTATSSRYDYNYERLETLGDAVLKFLCSIYLYAAYPSAHEGQLTKTRSLLISNSNLLRCGLELGLPRFLQTRPVLLHNYYPPGFVYVPPSITTAQSVEENMQIEGSGDEEEKNSEKEQLLESQPDAKECEAKGEEEELQGTEDNQNEESGEERQAIADKTIADSVEAIIAVFYLLSENSFDEVWTMMIHRLGVIIDPVETSCTTLSSEAREITITQTKIQFNPDDAVTMNTTKQVEELLQYHFHEPCLLHAALTHGSYWIGQNSAAAYESGSLSYQRLEFLGDAVFGLIVTEYLFEMKTPQLDPENMTKWRSLIVSNHVLCYAMVQHGLHQHIKHDSPHLDNDMSAFAAFAATNSLESVVNLEDAEDIYLSNEQDQEQQDDNDLKCLNIPKVLADVMEAMIGAVFLDSRGDMEVCTQLIHRVIIEPFITTYLQAQVASEWGIHCHPTTVVFEMLSKIGCTEWSESYEKEVQPSATTANDNSFGVSNHDYKMTIHGEVFASAQARNKKSSRRIAMKQLLAGNPQQLLERIQSICTCNQTAAAASEEQDQSDVEDSMVIE